MAQLGHDLQLISLEQVHNYSLVVISTESLYQLAIFLQFRLELGLNSVITSYALLYISQLSNHNMGMTEFNISTYLFGLIAYMIYMFTNGHT